MKKRITSVLLLLFLLLLSLRVPVFADALEQEQLPDWIWEPVVEKDGSLSTGQVTEWACVTFGVYPQTEIVPAVSSAVDDYAVNEGDFLVDPALYKTLAEAEWQDGETEIGGVRYRRLAREGAVSAAADSPSMRSFRREI